MSTKLPVIDEAQRHSLTKSLLAETIAMLEKAMLDALDEEEALDCLRPHLINAGTAFTINMRKWFNIQGNDLEAIAQITLLFETLFEVDTIEIEKTEDKIVRVGGPNCPYKDLPPLECRTREVAMNAMVNFINPDYCFKIERMMPRGDASCCWVIEKRK